jgi:hypothetical protein
VGRFDVLSRVLGSLAALVGAVASVHYARTGLSLSHYDARAHLVVARRILDSITPGWEQIGAVWLPLPHVLTMLPVQVVAFYRTGFPAIAVSVAALGVGAAAMAAIILRLTGSRAGAIAAAGLFVSNPNVLYLHATPMTEPLLFGLSLACLAAMDGWCADSRPASRRRAAWLLASLVLTRYEGWLVAAGLVGIGAWIQRRLGPRELAALMAPASGAVVAFLVLSWASTGRWFLSTDFFVPEGEALHQPLKAAGLVLAGTVTLGGVVLAIAAGAGLLACVVAGRQRPWARLPLSLTGAGLLPLVAFTAGHPFRVRYMVALVVAAGVLSAAAVMFVPRRVRAAAGVALAAAVIGTMPPLDPTAPMVTEAQWETPFMQARRRVSQPLRERHDGTPILASMGSLAHYMHEASGVGFHLRDFLHEGNGDLWAEALKSPRRSVRWVLVEERAEGGDVLAARARSDPGFLSGFSRVAEGGGLVLYRRD